MPKQMFEQSIGENSNGEISEAERNELIEEAEERLQALMTRATRKLNLAYGNKLISEDDEARLFAFLESVNEKIGTADESSKDINETLVRLKELGNLLKLPEDIKKENAVLVLQKLEEWAEAKKNREEKNVAETMASHDKITYDKGTKHRSPKKLGGGLFGRKTGSGTKYRGEPFVPPTV